MTQVLLAIDTSQGTTAAVLVDGKLLAEITEENSMQHAENIGTVISNCLQKSGKKSSEVTAVAIGLGPAPFTGLRVGIAAAKLFAEGVGAHLFGVSSLDALAFDLELSENTLVTSDARRSEVYFSLYRGKTKAGVPIILQGPGVSKLADLEHALATQTISYQLLAPKIRASSVGQLLLSQLSDGTASSVIQANYLRAPDAVPAKGKKVSG
jgi:tRNA threonylcarbamoyl adenosine modification protein YeaZ